MMSGQYHTAAALFQAIPAWLRFLESRRLIDAETCKDVLAKLLPRTTSSCESGRSTPRIRSSIARDKHGRSGRVAMDTLHART